MNWKVLLQCQSHSSLLHSTYNNKPRSKILRGHSAVILLSDYFPPLFRSKFLYPCRIPKTFHVCLPYKILSSLSEGPLQHATNMASSQQQLDDQMKTQLVSSFLKGSQFCVLNGHTYYHSLCRTTDQSRINITQRKFWPLSSAPGR